MLVLSRKPNESVMFGDEIEVTVIEIRGDKVRLGISAPSNVSIHRKEVYARIQEELQAGATPMVSQEAVLKAVSEKVKS